MKRITLFLLLLIGIGLQVGYAQERTITGTVTQADDGSTLPGVNIKVKGTVIGTITDFDGKYKLKVPADAQTLVFSFVGMQTKEVAISGKSEIDVALTTDAKGLEEVVIVGYGVQKKSDLTGSVASIKSEEIVETPVLGVDKAIQGRAAGVQVTSDNGAPGSGVEIRIRGVGTTENADPLFVVDGFPVDDITYLNPGDIESIEVLKDASASAIYGARAANGVILVTTKKGKVGKAVITFDSYWGNQRPWNKPDMVNSTEWYHIVKEGKSSFRLEEPADDTLHTTDWFDEIIRVAPMQNYNLSISGGTEVSKYMVSTNYFQQDGIVKNTSYDRITFRINTDNKISNRISIGNNFALSHTKGNFITTSGYYSAPVSLALRWDPLTPVRDEEGNFLSSPYNDEKNPVAQLEYNNPRSKTFKMVGNVFADIKIMDGLTFRTSGGITLIRYDNYNFQPTYYIDQYDKAEESIVSRYYSKTDNWLWENTLTYHKEFGDHDVTALIGYTAQENRWENMDIEKKNAWSNKENLWYLSGARDHLTTEGGASEWAMLSYLGRINYSFKHKYLLTASFRRDGSSKFGPNNRWGFFPSFSLGWNVKNEAFLQNTELLSALKVRFGWGQIGNDRIPNYLFETSVAPNDDYNYSFGSNDETQSRVYGAGISVPGNPDIKWEAVETTNIGIDFGFFSNQITGTFDYFVKNTKDMLFKEPLPETTGYDGSYYMNAGEVQNKGVELSLTHRKATGHFTYEISFNISAIQNEVIKLNKDSSYIIAGGFREFSTTRTEKGHPIGEFYGYVTDGLFPSDEAVDEYTWDDPTTEEIEEQKIQPKAKAGYYKYKDLNNDGIISDADRDFIGSPFPDFVYGINFACAYKGFDLSLFFQGSQGNDIYHANEWYTLSHTQDFNKAKEVLEDSWSEDNPNGTLPVIDARGEENFRGSDRYIEDGSYLRLKNAQFGYTIPKTITKKVGIDYCRIYVGGYNLLTFTNYTGLDPEIGGYELAMGVDYGTYPQARNFLFGVNLSF